MCLSHIVAGMCPEECVCAWSVITSFFCNSVFSRWCFGGIENASSHSSQYEALQSQTEPVGRTVWPGGNTYMCFGFLQTKETLDGLKMCTCVVVWGSKRRSDKSETRKLQRCQTSQIRPQNLTGRMDRIDYAKTRRLPREQVCCKT